MDKEQGYLTPYQELNQPGVQDGSQLEVGSWN